MIHRGFRYRLYPTEEQAALLRQFAGATRFVYNLALEQRRDFWRQAQAQSVRFDFVSQGREVTALRAQCDWLSACPSVTFYQALRDLDRAYAAFFQGRAGYPSPRKKGVNDSFRFKGVDGRVRRLNGKWSVVRIPRIGWVKFRDTRARLGRTLNVTVALAADGWHVIFAAEIECEPRASNLPAVGIDRGVANTIALSTGQMLYTPETATLDRRKRKAQRALARKVRGSARYRRQRRIVAALAGKISRVRAHWRHEATRSIADRFGTVSLEALKIPNMTARGRGKRGLNRSILEQGWGAFERVLSYKLEERGGTLIKVNPAYTSQECSACGTIDKASRKSQASFACRHCGFAAHADTNAAINILRRSTAGVEGHDCVPDEARTINHAALAA